MAVDIEYARRDDLSLAYTVIGDGPIDLVFGVGLMSHIDLLWGDPHASSFLERLAVGCRVILFDKPGTGLSDPVTGDPTIEERMGDFLAVLDAAGSRRAVVLGLSEAGPPAAMLAAVHPDRVEALVLVSTMARLVISPDYLPHLDDYVERHVWRWLWHGADHWGDGQLLQAMSPWFRRTPVYARLAPSVERTCSRPAMARAIIRSLRSYDVREALPSVRTPTLVVGRSDEWVPADALRDLAERVAGARLEILPGDEHLCFFDGDDIADAITRFVGGTPSSRPRRDRSLVTLLYTDIVASTSSVAAVGDERWRRLIGRHDDVVAEETGKHEGRVVKSLGDGALAAFDRPLQAVRCAMAINRRVAELGLDIRSAVHTGECELVGDDVSGIAAHIGSRLLDHAGAGDVIVSSTVRDLTLGSGLELEPRATVTLRDVPGRWEILAVTAVASTGLRPATTAGVRGDRASSADDTMTTVDRSMLVAARRAPGATRAVLAVASRFRRRPEAL